MASLSWVGAAFLVLSVLGEALLVRGLVDYCVGLSEPDVDVCLEPSHYFAYSVFALAWILLAVAIFLPWIVVILRRHSRRAVTRLGRGLLLAGGVAVSLSPALPWVSHDRPGEPRVTMSLEHIGILAQASGCGP